MRIISNFHDYYDCIQQYGQDRTVVYLRKEKVIEGCWPFPRCNSWYGKHGDLSTIRIIGFCGKIIPLIELTRVGERTPKMCWSLDDIDTFMKTELKGRAFDSYMKSKWHRGVFYSQTRKGFQKFFSECRQRENAFEHLFRDHHSPLFVATYIRRNNSEIIFNTPLKKVEFYAIMDTYKAFQEISMYMGGVLGTHGGHKTKYQGKPMSSEVSDKDLIVAKGFDKHSFRNSK